MEALSGMLTPAGALDAMLLPGDIIPPLLVSFKSSFILTVSAAASLFSLPRGFRALNWFT